MDRPRLGRLIVVDDETELMTILSETLKKQGYETEGFTSGPEALQRMKEDEFDLILTDLMMPEMNGIELLEAALAIDPGIIGIVMTGQGTVKTAVEAMKIGAFDYILKPFKMNILLPAVSRAMGVRNLKKENIELRGTLAIYELTKAVTLSTDLTLVANKVADAAIEQTSADEVSIMLPTENDDELYVAAIRGRGRNHILGQRVKLGQSVAGWVARHHELLTLEGNVTDARFKPLHPRAEITTAVSIPMMAGGKFVGVLNLNSINRRSFTIGQIKALTITISMAAPSIQNAGLFQMLQEAESKYHSLFENAVEGIFQITPEGCLITANPSLARILGYDSSEELVGRVIDIKRRTHIDSDHCIPLREDLGEKNEVIGFETQMYCKNGTIKWVSENIRAVRAVNGKLLHYEGSVEDITNRKIAEAQQILYTEILELLNQPGEKIDIIRVILSLLKKHIQAEAVGIRLREAEDFPYYETEGFPEAFIEAESYLCAHDGDGKLIRDPEGNACLEGVCGNVLRGCVDASLPFFTECGSFWTNNVSQLLASTPEKDILTRKRNRCKIEGYESMALIPLRSGNQIIGLLQINDRKSNLFSIDKIKFLEGIGASIGIALARKQAEEELENALEKLKKSLACTIQVISTTIEIRDPYTAGHQKRVANLACAIAREMGLPDDTIDNIRTAGSIHDIGKMSVPAEMLVKPTILSDIEMSLIKVHPKSGYDILKDVDLPYPIAETIFQHHERIDGSGYPQGLKDAMILTEAKILAVADVVEAIASHRPYRPALGIDSALNEIEEKKGILYDPGIVDICLKLFKKKGFCFE